MKKNEEYDLIQSFINIDLGSTKKILNNNEYYLNRQKSVFMVLLTQCFINLQKKGDTKLYVSDGRCMFPTFNVNSYTFTGNFTGNYLELNIHAEEGRVTGLSECYCYSTEDNSEMQSVRLYIDPKRGSTL
ncbi:hypothetical protein [Dyadobacter sp. 3J3]|uniref:hypothetical protein n=1 Tax=Dyadobacter sp. 3J3 TaxID=2606600 RepID=UPI001359569F|nr:hypothetical protein [Dyadobacter sp. 3J3]